MGGGAFYIIYFYVVQNGPNSGRFSKRTFSMKLNVQHGEYKFACSLWLDYII